MEFEIVTIGAGRFLFELFQFMAAITTSTAFQSLTILAAVMSFAFVGLMIAGQQRGAWEQTYSWLLFGVLILGGLTVMPARVKITDRIDHVNSAGYIVDRAPLLLVALMSVTTRTGAAITESFEDNLVGPNDPLMSDHGFLFGVDLVKHATQIEFADANFRQSLSNYIKSCTMTEIAHGHKSVAQLAQSQDVFEWLMDPASQVHFFEWQSTSGTRIQLDIIRCDVGVARFRAAIAGQETEAVNQIISAAVPQASDPQNNMNNAAVRNFVTNELEGMHAYLMNASRSATEILRQQMTINLVHRAQLEYFSEKGAEGQIALLRDSRARLQEQHTNSAFANLGKTGVPVLYALFQIVFVGMFPIVAILMFTIGWKTFFKNYFLSLAAFETWAPMFAVLHWVMNADARNNLLAESTGGITMATQDVVSLTHNQISNAAGHWLLMIPVASMMIFMGFRIATHFAGTALQPSLQAGSAAAAEATTGNHSYGNMSMGNASYFNESGFKTDTNFGYSAGQSERVLDSGGSRLVAGGGQVLDTVRASNLAGGIDVGNIVGQQHDQALTSANSLVQTTGKDLTERQEAAAQTAQSFGESFTQSTGWSNVQGFEQNAAASEDYTNAMSVVQRYADEHNMKATEAATLMGSVNAGGKSAGAFFAGFEGRGEWSGRVEKADAQNLMDSFSQDESAKEIFSKGVRAYDSLSASAAGGNATSFDDRFSAHESEITAAVETHGLAQQQREELQESYRDFQSQQANSGVDHSTAFQNYWRDTAPEEYEQFLANPHSEESRGILGERQEEYVANYRERHGGQFQIAETAEDLRYRYERGDVGTEKLTDTANRNSQRMTKAGGSRLEAQNTAARQNIDNQADAEINLIGDAQETRGASVGAHGKKIGDEVKKELDKSLMGRAVSGSSVAPLTLGNPPLSPPPPAEGK